MKKSSLVLFLFLSMSIVAVAQNNQVVDKTVKKSPNGTVTTTYKYSDGSSSYVIVSPCMGCKGQKVCRFCNGRGKNFLPYLNKYMPCASCYGTKLCTMCGGQGQHILTTWYNKDGVQIGSSSTLDAMAGTTQQNKSQPRENSQPREKRTCSSCGGTGLTIDYSHDSRLSAFDAPEFLCRQCGKRHRTTLHRNCPSCNGTGKI